MILGAQLYTLRNEMKTPEEIDIGLKAVAEMGYTTVQVSGIGKMGVRTKTWTWNESGGS